MSVQRKYKAVRNIIFLCSWSLVVLLIWIVSSLESAPHFVEFDSDFREWFNRCYKFEFSRDIVFGASLDGIDVTDEFCKTNSRPDRRPSVLSQAVGYVGESAVPLLVAVFFARKILFLTYDKNFGDSRTTSAPPLGTDNNAKIGRLAQLLERIGRQKLGPAKSVGIMPETRRDHVRA